MAIMRTSPDKGANWSRARRVMPEQGLRPMSVHQTPDNIIHWISSKMKELWHEFTL